MLGKRKKVCFGDIPTNTKMTAAAPAKEAGADIKIVQHQNVHSITGDFSNSLDLGQILDMTRSCISYNAENELRRSERLLKEHEEFISKRLGTYIERQEKRAEMEKIKERRKELENLSTIFENMAAPIMEHFYKGKEKMDFEEQYGIIRSFLKMAREFVDINIRFCVQGGNVCECPSPPKYFITVASGMKVCPTCRTEVQVFDYIRSSTVPKPAYDDWNTMYRALLAWQGTLTKTLPDDLFERLETYFEKQGFPPSSEIRSWPCDKHGKKPNTSRALMNKALVDIDAASCSDVIQSIMAQFWGWKLPDLSRSINTFRKLFEMSREPCRKYRGDRKSLNIQYQMLQILYEMGHDIDVSDFKPVATADLRCQYNVIWSMVANELGWKWIRL